MSTPIQDYAASVKEAFDAIDAALETASAKLAGITDDIAFLKETIDKLQNNPGPITPEDQLLLNDGQTRVAGLAAKLTAFKEALTAVDDATERPTPPPQVSSR